MEAALEQAWSHASIPAELKTLRPHGDLVLVRVIPEPEMSGRIVLPQAKRENLAPRIGEVIAVGPGDKLLAYWCERCERTSTRLVHAKIGKCRHCKRGTLKRHDGLMARAPMHVKPGDRILYWRTYANEVVVNEELYQFLHEEQHIVAVLEN